MTAKECENVRLYQALMKGGVVSQASPLNELKSAAATLSSTGSSNQILDQRECVNIQVHTGDETERDSTEAYENKVELSHEANIDSAKSKTFVSSSPRPNASVDVTDYFRDVSDEAITGSPSKPSETSLDPQGVDISSQHSQLLEQLSPETHQKAGISVTKNLPSHHECKSPVLVEGHADTSESRADTQQSHFSAEQLPAKQVELDDQVTKETKDTSNKNTPDSSDIHQTPPSASDAASSKNFVDEDAVVEPLQSKGVDLSNTTCDEESSSPHHFTSAESKVFTSNPINVTGLHSNTQQDGFSAEKLNDDKSLRESKSDNYAPECVKPVSNLNAADSSNILQTGSKLLTNEPEGLFLDTQQIDLSTKKTSEELDKAISISLGKQSESSNHVTGGTNAPNLADNNPICSNVCDSKSEHSSVERHEGKESESLPSMEQSFVEKPGRTTDISSDDPENASSNLRRPPSAEHLPSVAEFIIGDDSSKSFADSRKSLSDKFGSDLDSSQSPKGGASSSSQ